MCGIGGILCFGPAAPVGLNSLKRMAASLAHRGPDGEGTWISADGVVGLLHTRLSITDHSTLGRQPMHTADGRITLVFNGEIYNHSSLRRQLTAEGYTFESATSDSEVLLHAYRHWGPGCVARLRGMFAFAVWDAVWRRLILARDAVGIKPLYYSFINGAVVFASEISAVFASGLPRKEICEDALYDYLTFLCVPAPRTLFRNISKLEPGCLLSIGENGKTETTRFWDSASFLNSPIVDDEQMAEQRTAKLLCDAVGNMTATPMPLAATLSGGVDSALVAALMSQRSRCFLAATMDYEVQSLFSESEYASRIAAALQVTSIRHRVTGRDLMEAIRELTTLGYSDPLAANDALLLYVLSRDLKRRGVHICFMGEGADELGGYPSYLSYQKEYRTLSYFVALPGMLKAAVLQTAPTLWRERLEIAAGGAVASRRHIQGFSETQKRTLWKGRGQCTSHEKLLSLMAEIRNDCPDSFLRKVQHLEFRLRLPEFLLARVDGSMMANAVEVRLPFLDQALVEYSLRLPMSLKMNNGIAKYLFRSILSKYLKGGLVATRKIGFGRVMTPFLNNISHNLRSEIISTRGHPIFEYLDRRSIEGLLTEHERTGSHGYSLWLIYAIGIWIAAQHNYARSARRTLM